MKKLIYILSIFCLVQSCDYFNPIEEEKAIARVNEVYLFLDDLKMVLPENLSKADSIMFANHYVNQWATQQLLVQGAEINLSDKKLESNQLNNREVHVSGNNNHKPLNFISHVS